MEILIALVPMLAWGSIGLVSGKIGGDANQQTLGMTIGAFLFSLVVFFVVSPVITPWIFLIGFLSGLAWSVGQNGQFHGMKYMGVSVGLPLSTGFQLILNTIAGAVFFHEWTQTKDYVYGIIALALLVSGAYLTARQDDEGKIDTDNKMLDFGKGFRALIFSTIGYGVYTIIVNWANLDAMSIILPQSIGMILGASFFAFSRSVCVEKHDLWIIMGLRKHLHASNSQITWFSCWLLTFTNGDHYLYFRWDFHPWRKKNEKRAHLCYCWLPFSHFRWYPFRVYENSLIAVFQPKMGRNFNGFVS